MYENCYFKSSCKPKLETLLLWTRNLRKSDFAKLSLKPHTTHPHLSWFTWWYTAGASCCLLILYLVAKYQVSSGPHGPIFSFDGCRRWNWIVPYYQRYPFVSDVTMTNTITRCEWTLTRESTRRQILLPSYFFR